MRHLPTFTLIIISLLAVVTLPPLSRATDAQLSMSVPNLTALSFEIAPRKQVHETLTLMASDCLSRGPGAERPSSCVFSPAAVMNDDLLKKTVLNLDALGLGEVSAKELRTAVKWPDDPTREVPGVSIAKFGFKMWRQCEKYNTGSVNDGLLCSSHFGSLQFWHAMASTPKEPTAETQRKMLAWAEFLYDVAVDDGDVKLNDNYCKYWHAQRNREGKEELARALVPDGYFACTKTGPPWTISTLFDMKCKNPFSSDNCPESRKPRVARINAIGALLHMIQDSFAQGHAGRGECARSSGPDHKTSKFECLAISQFYTYTMQDAVRHRQADAPPQAAGSCASESSEVDNPILASATALWFVQQKKGRVALVEYLRVRVFPLADGHEPHAGAGCCFTK